MYGHSGELDGTAERRDDPGLVWGLVPSISQHVNEAWVCHVKDIKVISDTAAIFPSQR